MSTGGKIQKVLLAGHTPATHGNKRLGVHSIIQHEIMPDGRFVYRVLWEGQAPTSDTWLPEDALLDGAAVCVAKYWQKTYLELALQLEESKLELNPEIKHEEGDCC